MTIKQLIPALPSFTLECSAKEHLKVAEFFCDTIQGEGIHRGIPSAILRLQGCTLNCNYCDTSEVLRHGNPYSFSNLLELFEKDGLSEKLKRKSNYHLIITGGSPLLQQNNLAAFLEAYESRFKYIPFIEIENECVLRPIPSLIQRVACWNNSPKLSNSGITKEQRYRPDIIKMMNSIQSSEVWFKFVIGCKEDWNEIQRDFIDTNLIDKKSIILMPKGASREELHENREFVIELAIQNCCLYSGREHIELWDKKIGV